MHHRIKNFSGTELYAIHENIKNPVPSQRLLVYFGHPHSREARIAEKLDSLPEYCDIENHWKYCSETILALKNNKSAGSDGIPALSVLSTKKERKSAAKTIEE